MRGGLFPRNGAVCGEVYSREMVSVRGGLFPRDGAVCGELYSREMVSVQGALFPRDGAVCGEVYYPRNGRTSVTVLNAAVSQQTHRVQELLALI